MAEVSEYRDRMTGDAFLDGWYFENVPSDETGLLDLMEVISGHIDEAYRNECIYDRSCTHINHEDISEVLYDRGYGNIFIHSENDVNIPTDHLFFADLALRGVGEDERRLGATNGHTNGHTNGVYTNG